MKETSELLAALTLLQKAALLSGANTWQTRAIDAIDLPAIWASDGPHGIRKQTGSADHLGINGSEPATCFPPAATIANSWDVELATRIGTALGVEAHAQGVNVLLGPGLNLKRSPLGGRNFEYFSEDPELAGNLAAAYVRGIQSQGVAASPKHFAVNSQELRRMVSDSIIDERTFRELYLTAFEIVVREAAPWTIMSAYNRINGVYAHENTHLLTGILREEWGFDGAVVTDWGGGNDPVAAVRAGGTLEMPSPGFDSARALVAAVQAGTLAEAELDARVAEVVDLVRRVTARADTARVDADAHHALARTAAAESAVLLRNEDDLLPLTAGTRVALIGEFADVPRYQGAGSSLVNALRVTTLRGALADTALDVVGFAAGFRRDGGEGAALRAEAVDLARRAEVAVLALGLPESAESEGMDRSSLSLPDDQRALLAAVSAVAPHTVVVLSAGGVLETPWIAQATAVLHGYLGGQAGGEAIADVLTGVVEPGGRLAETMPVHLVDTPTAGRFPSTLRTSEYREALAVGYRWYERSQTPVAFPFGFGLGYTRFAYSALAVAEDEVRVTVTNTGAREGSDVVQLYIGRRGRSRVHRAVRELKGFAKVRLAPGAHATVTIPLGERAYRYFDAERGTWEIEGGEYEIAIGRSSEDIVATHLVSVPGTVVADGAIIEPSAYLAHAVRDASDADFAALLRRPLPAAEWGSGPLQFNDPIDRLRTARSRAARFVFRILDRRRRAAEQKGMPDLNILFMFNAPFRVLSKMSGGLATRELTDAVLTLVNGRTFRGLGAVIAAYLRGRRTEKATAAQFRADDTPAERTR